MGRSSKEKNMNQEKSSDAKRRIGVKQLTVIVVTVAIACGIILTIGYFAEKHFDEFDSQEMSEITDEISRTRYFISDWYSELLATCNNDCNVYLNELRFDGGTYSLTFAGGRLRAVYPRGERFFKFYYIRRIEFFEIDGKVRCRVYYGQTGEYTFTV